MLKRVSLVSVTCIAGLLTPVLAVGQDSQTQKHLRIYFIGNSVTDTINYRALAELAKSRSHGHVWGRHMIPGAPLQWIWQHPDQGFQQQPFGRYPTALKKHQWDALSLQPFDRHIMGDEGDIVMAKNFIGMALPESPDVQVYVYARWPRKDKDGSLDYGKKWLRKYTGGWDGTNETKDYFERLTLELRKACPELKKPPLMIPVGHVMFALDKQMQSGEIEGYSDISQVYKDGIHLNNVGSYIVGCTFLSTLYKESPEGLPSSPYGINDSKLTETIQDAVWEVVSIHELSGVENKQPK
jgi:hypothetical protein